MKMTFPPDAPVQPVLSTFQRSARLSPRSVGVRAGSQNLTYEEIDHLSTLLAARIWQIRPDCLGCTIALYAHRSAAAVIGLLGILKTGADCLLMDAQSGLRPTADLIVTELRSTHGASFSVPCIYIPDHPEEAAAETKIAECEVSHSGPAQRLLFPAHIGDPTGGGFLQERIGEAVEQSLEVLKIEGNITSLSVAAIDDPVFLLALLIAFTTGGSIRLLESLSFLGRIERDERPALLLADVHELEALPECDGMLASLDRLLLTGDVLSSTLAERVENRLPASRVYLCLADPRTADWPRVTAFEIPRAASETREQIPLTETERMLISVWEMMLPDKSLGVDEDFFELGANSLLASLVCSQVLSDSGTELSIVDVYNYPNIRVLAERIDGLKDRHV